jgi:recombination protein RecA
VVLQAQQAGEPCAWLTRQESSFFPPDFYQLGIDLAALPVIFTPSAPAAARAGARLIRSDGFGLVVLDLGAAVALPLPLLGRMAKLALQHHAAFLFICEKGPEEPSLSSLTSLRIEAQRRWHADARFCVRTVALKDKRRGPHWSQEEMYLAPAGLR